VTNNPLLPIGVIPANWQTGATMAANTTYSTYYPNAYAIQYISTNGVAASTLTDVPVPNSCGLLGYSKPYSSSFSRGMN